MTQYAAPYAERLMSPAAAAALIPSGARIAMALGVGQPPALLKALADRAEAREVGDINIYYLLSTAIAGETVLRFDLTDRLRPHSLFHGAIERGLEARGVEAGRQAVWFVPTGFQQTPRVLTHEIGVDTLLATVSPMDADGYFSFGTNTDYALAASKTARRVILEVNPHMPRVFGDCTVHVSQVTALVEHAAPLLEAGKAAQQPQDLIIGGLIAGLIENGSTLQMGIGALPDAVCAALHDHVDLGIHTEMLTPGLVELVRAGAVTNARKTLHPGKTVFTFSMGDRATYDFLHENPAVEAHPVDYVNDPAVIARNAQMVSVNATLQIDLFGACCSEYLKGRQYTAAGGQLDFVRGASASPGGKSIIACHSTAARGTASRIVAKLDGPVTTPRNDTQIVVTEHGWVNLRGMTVDQRARALIGLAAPQFRAGLEAEARTMGLI
ncbi:MULTISPECIES: acetyl-CoA hydrolase/transferase family protein [unclassified Brevundimonas]|uniref:acetyl-CoA hydrolase/transferase family protein n=1 Tax=unclassified Brevundimonas TaxID=2622653 RepID=UPI0025C35642|nr:MULTISPECIES: acetyl-CoA hydrolase/transferase C-terminal domain-containing protein [unclassified Brevundimonas]